MIGKIDVLKPGGDPGEKAEIRVYNYNNQAFVMSKDIHQDEFVIADYQQAVIDSQRTLSSVTYQGIPAHSGTYNVDQLEGGDTPFIAVIKLSGENLDDVDKIVDVYTLAGGRLKFGEFIKDGFEIDEDGQFYIADSMFKKQETSQNVTLSLTIYWPGGF